MNPNPSIPDPPLMPTTIYERLAVVETQQRQTLEEIRFLRLRLSGRPTWAVTTIITVLAATATGSLSLLVGKF